MRRSLAQAVLDAIENPDVAQALCQDKNQNLQYLKDNYNVTLEHITGLCTFGKFQYSYGTYSGAADYLALGKARLKYPSRALGHRIRGAQQSARLIDSRSPVPLLSPSRSTSAPEPALKQLHSRTWLVHWSLFVYFNHPQGRTLLLETFLSPIYLNTIQTACPWILRYLTAAAILSRKASVSGSSSRVRHAVREVVKIIQMEEYQYSDPVTNFLKELYVEFDFESAQKELARLRLSLEFLDNARYLISEAYCRIHQKIDIGELSDRLNLSRDEGEKYIVNLIRETRMGADAKIDLEKDVIHISRPALLVYQTVQQPHQCG
ncbi:hypothetical protein BDZ89DRAFT_1164308 [Hymenopellis radicata]|nr:hypothetical protein BDZ89DRAFT_1164308 [Hymenopellis radicata]